MTSYNELKTYKAGYIYEKRPQQSGDITYFVRRYRPAIRRPDKHIVWLGAFYDCTYPRDAVWKAEQVLNDMIEQQRSEDYKTGRI